MEKILIFVLLLFLSVLIYWFVVPQRWRSGYLMLLSLLFAGLFSVKCLLYFLFTIVIVYAAAIYLGKPDVNKKSLLMLALVWLVGNLCYFKLANLLIDFLSRFTHHFSILPEFQWPTILLPVGVSYIIFRLIHYLVEVYRNKAPRGTFIDFTSYVLFFPTFIAGPVERFQQFHPQIGAKKSLDVSDISNGLIRIACGIVKKAVIGDTLAKFVTPVLSSPHEYAQYLVIASIYGVAIQLYMDFSGYTDIAIGMSRLFGYTIIENFDRPFFKHNIALFWRSWHISLSSWIRDYFFFPFFGARASTFKLYAGILLTMIVFHLWHGVTIGFFILGAYHGLGIMTCQFFQELKRKYPRLRSITAYTWAKPVSVFVTFSFVSFGFIFFFFDIQTSLSIIKNIFM